PPRRYYALGITPDADPNRDLPSDRTVQRNLGLDMSFLKSQLSMSLDGYYNTTTDMLTDMSGAIGVPISVGGAFAEQNYAGVKAWGTEVSVTWKSHVNEVNYSIGMNFGLSNYKTTDRKSTRLNSSHVKISYAVFCLKKKKK